MKKEYVIATTTGMPMFLINRETWGNEYPDAKIFKSLTEARKELQSVKFSSHMCTYSNPAIIVNYGLDSQSIVK